MTLLGSSSRVPSPAPPGSLADALLVRAGRAELDASWSSWAGPHGGLVAALALREALGPVGDRVPRSLHAHFLAPAPLGSVRLSSRLLREGGASAVAEVALAGAGTEGPVLVATLVAGRSRGPAPAVEAVPAPVVPGPQDCAPLVLPADLVPFSRHFAFRPANEARPGGGGALAELVAWVRPQVPVELDAAALTVLLDVMPPALYAVGSVPVPVPTVELSAAFTGVTCPPGWVLCRIATRHAADGWCVDDSEVWAPDGRLLAQARQTRRVLGDLGQAAA